MFIAITPDELARIIELMKQSQMNRNDARLIQQLEHALKTYSAPAFDLDEIPFQMRSHKSGASDESLPPLAKSGVRPSGRAAWKRSQGVFAAGAVQAEVLPVTPGHLWTLTPHQIHLKKHQKK